MGLTERCKLAGRWRPTVVLGMLAAAPSVWAEDSSLTWNVVAEARYEDNIGFAPDGPSKRDVVTTHVEAGVTWQPVQTALRDVSFTVGPYYDFVSDLNDLSNGGAIGRFALLQQFSPDFTSPWVSLDGVFTWMSFEDSNIRNGYKFDTKLKFGKRFNEKVALSLGYRYQLRVSTKQQPEGTLVDPISGDRHSNEVFDQDRNGPFINLEFNPSANTTFFAEYSYLMGDVAATAIATAFNDPDRFDSARDFAFGEGPLFLVWKLNADQSVYTMGVTQILSRRWQIHLTTDYLDAKGQSDNNYTDFVVTLGASRTF